MAESIQARPRSVLSRFARSQGMLLLPILLFCVLVNAGHGQPPDVSRGRMLYDNHCRFCHTSKVHERPGKGPLTQAQLRSIVNDWQRQEGLSWTAQDTEDVVEYLMRTRYQRLRK